MVSKCNGRQDQKCKKQAVCFPKQGENCTMSSGTKGRYARKILLEKYCSECVPDKVLYYNRNMCSVCQSSNGTYRITIDGVVTRYCDIHKPDGAELIDRRQVILTDTHVKAVKRTKMTPVVDSESDIDDNNSSSYSDHKSLSAGVNGNKRSAGSNNSKNTLREVKLRKKSQVVVSIEDMNPKLYDYSECPNEWV